MRIVDSDVLFKNLEWLDEYDSYVFHNVKINIDETLTVKAIPIEWIKEYASMKSFNDEMDCYWHFWEEDVLKMVADWEKENDR